jgi:hypothetical protein
MLVPRSDARVKSATEYRTFDGRRAKPVLVNVIGGSQTERMPGMSDSRFIVADKVAAALVSGQPVVALETTLVTHGLPRPDGLRVAVAMESAVRKAGAIPATIGILDGTVRVGLGHDEEFAGMWPMAGGRKTTTTPALRRHRPPTTSASCVVKSKWSISCFAQPLARRRQPGEGEPPRATEYPASPPQLAGGTESVGSGG